MRGRLPILLHYEERQLQWNQPRNNALPPPESFSTKLQSLNYTPIDPYLREAACIILNYFHKMHEIYPQEIMQVLNVNVNVTFSFEPDVLQSSSSVVDSKKEEPVYSAGNMPTGDRKNSTFSKNYFPIPLDVKNVADALTYLNYAELYSSNLAELLQVSRFEKLTEQIDKWRKLKEDLISFSIVIDKILQHYKFPGKDLPHINELKKIKNKILRDVKKINVDQFHKICGSSIRFAPEELVTAALGLNKSVANSMAKIRNGPCNHQTDEYHFKDIVCKAVEDNCSMYDPATDTLKILAASGFSDAKASLLAEKFQNDEIYSHQPLTYWIKLYLDFMFQHDIFLAPDCPYFPHHEDTLDSWMEITTTRSIYDDSTDEDYEGIFEVSVYNTVQGIESIMRDGVCYPPRDIEDGVWYHATDHESAESIRVNGIILTSGNKKQDFSSGDGFYLTPYLHFAEKWAEAKGGHSKGAIVVFRHSIDVSKYNGLNLSQETDEMWSQVVKYYRSGKQKSICPRSLMNRLKHADYIEGPMSRDPKKCTHPDWQPTKKEWESNQLCLKSEELASEFSGKIDGIIFMSTAKHPLMQPALPSS